MLFISAFLWLITYNYLCCLWFASIRFLFYILTPDTYIIWRAYLYHLIVHLSIVLIESTLAVITIVYNIHCYTAISVQSLSSKLVLHEVTELDLSEDVHWGWCKTCS